MVRLHPRTFSAKEFSVGVSLALAASVKRLLSLVMNTFSTSCLQGPYSQIIPVHGGSLPYTTIQPTSAQSPWTQIYRGSAEQDLERALSLGLLQQQFLQNFAFSNSARFHPKYLTDKIARSSSNPNLCSSIKEEILQQLAPEEKPVATTMLARGMKRQLDFRPEAHQKRARSEEESPSAPAQLPSQGITPPLPGPLRPHEYQRLTDEMMKYYENQQQRQDLYIRKMQLRDALYAVMKGVFPYCGLYVVGSSMNGFGAVNSDMDMCLMLSHCEIDQKREAREILRILLKSLKKCTFLKDINLIAAKVPILKFADKISGVECDLNINNSVGIRNTHLLSAYSKLDWRVNLLVLFVKNWAKTQNINDASQGTISSYSLVLMVLHYLQCGCKPPVIPSLQQKYPHKFNPKLDIRLLTLNDKLPPYSSPNQQLLGELFTGFLNYYANTFQFKSDVISIRLGGKLSREAAMMGNPTKNPRNQWKCLCIEEPFDLSNTARSVYDHMMFQRILRVIRLSYSRLRQSADVYSILNEPL